MKKNVQLHVPGGQFSATINRGIVYLYNSPALEHFLYQHKFDGALRLSSEILEVYQTRFSENLAVDVDSMAVEILGHFYFENFFEEISKVFPGRSWSV